MTAYIYGQAPGKKPKRDPSVPFLGGRHGEFLAQLAGVDESVLADLFTFRNVLDYYPGPNEDGKGDAFPMDEARERARELMDDWHWGDTAVLAGHNVAHAFGVPRRFPYFKWLELVGGVQCVVVPHPSRLNRFWNNAACITRASHFWKAAVYEQMLLHPEYEGGMLV